MFLGIEIGGTKLQVGVGSGQGADLAALVRADVVPQHGAAGILRQIQKLASPLIAAHRVERIGIGFGGPVDARRGRVVKSHQIAGWDDFLIGDWCREAFGLPVSLGNDCDAATLAEARFGAGQDRESVFYVTVGTGVGGGFVSNGQLMGRDRPAISEIGHLRPGLHADQPEATVESLASGWGIAAAAQERISGNMRAFPNFRCNDAALDGVELKRKLADAREADREHAADLMERCRHNPDQLTGAMVAQAAEGGNLLAQGVIDHACQVLGWAIAQMITLLAPEVVIVGGGVSSMGDELFLTPVRREVARYVFPPLAGSYTIQPAALGETVVVHGAILLAAGRW